MCGIAGVYHFKNSRTADRKMVEKMRDTLVHRGPDGSGFYLSKNKKVGLGHRRLAIIDLSEKNSQPFASDNKNALLVYNGEIYNFKELREKLENKGHSFKTRGDTEVLIKSYEEWGVDCVKKFNGMFSFVIWDEERELFFAARDHLGIKPFYYSIQDGSFYFGSEIKAIIAHPKFKKRFAEENASYYMTFASMPAPHTLFKDTHKLPAGHRLMLNKKGDLKIEEFWNPAKEADHYKNKSEDFYLEETRRILKDSIEKQMISDVPFGCFLSGGIDSSTNAALMSKALGKPVETFSIGFEDYKKYNEFKYAEQVANSLGANLHKITVGHKDLLRFLPEYAKHADDPNGDQICFLIYYLSKLIKDKNVTVAQVGEGADEIFAGYPSYLMAVNLYGKIWKYAEKLPTLIKSTPHKLMHPLNFARLDFSKDYARRLAKEQEPFWGNAIAFTPTQKERLLSENYKKKLSQAHEYEIIRKQYDGIKKINNKADFLEKLTYLELKIRLPELLLMRVDKMSMPHSVETRVPFLDHRLVELALNIPQSLKLKGGNTKHILKKAIEGIIPDEVIHRKKQGFSAPIKEWFRDPIASKPFKDVVFNSKLKERDILNYGEVERVFRAHERGVVDNNFRIWNLVSLSLWYDKWFE